MVQTGTLGKVNQADRQHHDERFKAELLPHLTWLERYIARRSNNPEDAQDLLQETLTSAYSSLHNFDGKKPRAWLRTIANRRLVDTARKKTPRPLRNPMAASKLRDTEPEPADLVDGVIIDSKVTRAFLGLSPNSREALYLSAVEGLPQEEISRQLHISVAAVNSRLHRGREGFKANYRSL